MGATDQVALKLPLLELYVPLRARPELPEGEAWTKELRVAGRKLSREEAAEVGERVGEARAVVELLKETDGVIVLGDPGAGKTTLLKYLALRYATGAGERLGLGRRLPVLVPLSAYATALADEDIRLDDFVVGYHRKLGLDLPVRDLVEGALGAGEALLLLDGLDEVKERATRRVVMDRVVDFFAAHRRTGNKFVFTSRIVGYRDVRPSVEGLAECTLVDFDDDDIEAFVEKWTEAIERAARGTTAVAASEAAEQRAELRQAIERNPGVRGLAANPLSLTILAVMKRQGMMLPDRRVELYDRYVATLLKTWNLSRGLGRPPARNLDVPETLKVLAPLALWIRMASENRDWGYTRIRGALDNLGHQVARGTIANVLREHGLEPAPERMKRTTWREFLAAHWDVLAAADFFTVEVWTSRGLTRFTVLVLIQLASRRVHIAGISAEPDGPWVTQLMRNATDAEDGFLRGTRLLIHDRDPLFSHAVRDTLSAAAVTPVRLPARSPNLNAFAERFVRTIKESCLERMILIGESSLRRGVREFVEHYHSERNHQGLGNRLIHPRPTPARPCGSVQCRQRLGGMLK